MRNNCLNIRRGRWSEAYKKDSYLSQVAASFVLAGVVLP